MNIPHVTFVCTHCNWRGENPSTTDASHEREDAEGSLMLFRAHNCVCPKCYQYVTLEVPS